MRARIDKFLFMLVALLSLTGCDKSLEEQFEKGIQNFRLAHTKYFGPEIEIEQFRLDGGESPYVGIRIVAYERLKVWMIYPNLGGSCGAPNWINDFPIELERGQVAHVNTDCGVILDLALVTDQGDWEYVFE